MGRVRLLGPLLAIDSNEVFREKAQLLTQHNKLAADASDGLAVVFSDVSDGLEIRHQTTGKPHQLDVALDLALKAPARLNTVEIAVDVDLQLSAGLLTLTGILGVGEGHLLHRKSSFDGIDVFHQIWKIFFRVSLIILTDRKQVATPDLVPGDVMLNIYSYRQ
jgi:hypothetical protein